MNKHIVTFVFAAFFAALVSAQQMTASQLVPDEKHLKSESSDLEKPLVSEEEVKSFDVQPDEATKITEVVVNRSDRSVVYYASATKGYKPKLVLNWKGEFIELSFLKSDTHDVVFKTSVRELGSSYRTMPYSDGATIHVSDWMKTLLEMAPHVIVIEAPAW